MADVEVRTILLGIQETLAGMREVQNSARQANQQTSRGLTEVNRSGQTWKRTIKDITQGLAGTAAIASIVARGNRDLADTLTTVSLALSGTATAASAVSKAFTLILRHPVVLALVAIGAAIVGIVKYWDELSEAATKAFDTVFQLFSGLPALIASAWQPIARWFADFWDNLVKSAQSAGRAIWSWITGDEQGLAEAQKQLGEALGGLRKQMGDTFDAAREGATKAANALKGPLSNAIEKVATALGITQRREADMYQKRLALFKRQTAEHGDSLKEQEEQYMAFLLKEIALAKTNRDLRVQLETEYFEKRKAMRERDASEQLQQARNLDQQEQEVMGKRLEDLQRMATLLGRRGMIDALIRLKEEFQETFIFSGTQIKRIDDLIEDLQLHIASLEAQLDDFRDEMTVALDPGTNAVEAIRGIRDAWVGMFQDVIANQKGFADSVAAMWDRIKNLILAKIAETIANALFQQLFGDALASIGGGLSSFFKFTAGQTTTPTPLQLSGPFAKGGIMSARGAVPLPRYYARGGVADGPQVAVFGEGSQPEAYVPLPDGRAIPVRMAGGGGGVTVNLNISTGVAQTVRAEMAQLLPQITESVKGAVVDGRRRGGSYGQALREG